MKKQPLVSVIIPTYNRVAFLGEAIESVLAQSYQNYEILVIDDGSIIDVKLKLKPYQDKIKYIYQENLGLAAARNRGIEEAKGEYIAFLDDDDLFEIDKLKTQVAVLEGDSKSGFVYSDGYIFKNTDPGALIFDAATGRLQNPELFAELFFMNPNVFVSALLIRRECFDELGGFDETLSQNEDGDMLLRIALKWKGKFSDYPSARVRYHNTKMSLDRIDMYKAVLKSWNKILKFYPQFKESLGSKGEDRISELHFLLAQEELKALKFKEARQTFELYFSLVRKPQIKARFYNYILERTYRVLVFRFVFFIEKLINKTLKLLKIKRI